MRDGICISTTSIVFGREQFVAEPEVYIWKDDAQFVIFVLYVDDILWFSMIVGRSRRSSDTIRSILKSGLL